jgi:hypothetical protein
MELVWFAPHMHLRGSAFRYEAAYPDGRREILLDVPKYDFNWQIRYLLAEPKLLPKGTTMHCTAYFDNSSNNLANPDPTETVRWGDQTWEEMMIGWFDIAVPKEWNIAEVLPPSERFQRARQQQDKNDQRVAPDAAE